MISPSYFLPNKMKADERMAACRDPVISHTVTKENGTIAAPRVAQNWKKILGKQNTGFGVHISLNIGVFTAFSILDSRLTKKKTGLPISFRGN